MADNSLDTQSEISASTQLLLCLANHVKNLLDKNAEQEKTNVFLMGEIFKLQKWVDAEISQLRQEIDRSKGGK